MNNSMTLPIAKANEPLATPSMVKATFVSASLRQKDDTTFIVIQALGLPCNILRTVKQAKGDLIEYYTKAELAKFTPELAVAGYRKYFKRKDFIFVGAYHEVGAIQTIDKFSSLYLSKEKEIGDEVETTSASLWVEGFLAPEMTDEEIDAMEAKALASAMAVEDNDVPVAP